MQGCVVSAPEMRAESSTFKQWKGSSDTSSDLQGINLPLFPALFFSFISTLGQCLTGTNTSSSASSPVDWSVPPPCSHSAPALLWWNPCHAHHAPPWTLSCAPRGRWCRAAPSAPCHAHQAVSRSTLCKATLPPLPVAPGLLSHAAWCSPSPMCRAGSISLCLSADSWALQNAPR